MGWEKEKASLGRRLMAVRQRLAVEGSPGEVMDLRAKAMRLLLALGNVAGAVAEARTMVSADPDDPRAATVLGDALCYAGLWGEALEAFSTAAGIRRRAGQESEASRIELGPAYRIAEGLGRYGRCMELTAGGGILASVLHARASRLAGVQAVLPPLEREADDRLIGGIHYLESSLRGASPVVLPDLVMDWGPSEPEWRWRLLFEGVRLFESRLLPLSRWKKAWRSSGERLLDPRWAGEASALRKLLGPASSGPR